MNSSGLTPLGEVVLIKVKEDEKEKVTKGGIVLPQSVTEKENKANIVAEIVELGELAFEHLSPDTVREAQFVVIERYAGRFIVGRDEKVYRLVKDTDILAVCQGEWEARYAA